MKLVIISRRRTKEVADLLHKSKARGIKCTHIDINDPNEIPSECRETDIVYWRSASITKTHPKTVARSVALQRLQSHAKVVNRVLADSPSLTNKSVQQSHFAHRLPFMRGIETYLAGTREDLDILVARQILRFPCIAKPDQGSQGNGIHLLNNKDDFDIIKHLSKYVFQNYIPNDCDYRAFVIGGVAVDIVRRRSTDASTHSYLNNISQGGTCDKLLDQTLKASLGKKAEAIAAAFDYTVCGVDLIQNSETGDIHFMEINSAVQWIIFEKGLSVDIGDKILDNFEALAERAANLFPSQVKKFYECNLKHLPVGKQFHFLSRLYMWNKDEMYKDSLRAIKDNWFVGPEPLTSLAGKIPALPKPKRVGGRAYRKQSYKKHFKIYKYNFIFFKALFLETIYKDTSNVEALISAIHMDDIKHTREQLLSDTEAIFRLATHAVNFLYHYEHFFGANVDALKLLEIGDSHSLEDKKDDVEARCYMYTHAVIGASRFYRDKKISTDLSVYAEMVRRVESMIRDHFTSVTLDVKCEFLVCAHLVGFSSSLEQAIRNEVLKSGNRHGDYYIDTLNIGSNKFYKEGFINSEHRNVLSIMALDQ